MELALTLLQSVLGVLLLSNFRFEWYEALGLFGLWFAQFLVPDWREEISWVYAGWIALELVSAPWRRGRLAAFTALPGLWRRPPPSTPAAPI